MRKVRLNDSILARVKVRHGAQPCACMTAVRTTEQDIENDVGMFGELCTAEQIHSGTKKSKIYLKRSKGR